MGKAKAELTIINVKKIFKSSTSRRRHIKKEILEKLAALITAAFGLVAAFAWNGVIRAIFEEMFGTADSIPAMLIYAVIVTIIAVLITIWVTSAVKRSKGEKTRAD